MTQEAIVKGFARWYGKRIIPTLAPFSVQRVAQYAAVVLAEKQPTIALVVLGNAIGQGAVGFLGQILAGVGSDEVFDAIADAMREALNTEHVKFSVLDANGPRGYEIDGEEFSVVLAEIKAANVECSRPQTVPSVQEIHPAIQNRGVQ